MASTPSRSSHFDHFPSDDFVGFALFERLGTGACVCTYKYPSLDSQLHDVLMSRLSFDAPAFSYFAGTWHYNFPIKRESAPGAYKPSSECACVCVLSRTQAPETFLPLAKVLADAYAASASPIGLVKAWNAAFRRGTITNADIGGSSAGGDSSACVWTHTPEAAMRALAPTGLKRFCVGLGGEVVFAWAALLLGRRVAVYGAKASDVVKSVRVCASLVAHRSRADDGTGVPDAGVKVYPLVSLSAPGEETIPRSDRVGMETANSGIALQISELRELGHFIAGFTDAGIAGRGGDLWDVCVDISAAAVTIAENAKADLPITAVHKDVGKTLLALLDDDASTDADIVNLFRDKNVALIDRLRQALPDGGVDESAAGLAAFAKALPASFGNAEGVVAPALERFLWNVAVAELRRR